MLEFYLCGKNGFGCQTFNSYTEWYLSRMYLNETSMADGQLQLDGHKTRICATLY